MIVKQSKNQPKPKNIGGFVKFKSLKISAKCEKFNKNFVKFKNFKTPSFLTFTARPAYTQLR